MDGSSIELYILNISLFDRITGLKLNNIQKYKLIVKVSPDGIVKGKTYDEDFKMGIVRDKNNNTIPVPMRPFILSYDGNHYLDVNIDFIHEKNVKNLKNENKTVPRPVTSQKKIPTPTNKWIVDIHNFHKMETLRENVKNTYPEDHFLQFGRLSWYKNSCFADSVIMMLLLKMFENGDVSEFVKREFLQKKLLDVSQMSQAELIMHNCFKINNVENFNQSIDNLNTIYTEFGELNRQLESRNIINLNPFLKIMDRCKTKSKAKFSSGRMQDADEFLKSLFSIFDIHFNDLDLGIDPNISTLTVNIKFDQLQDFYRKRFTKPSHIDLMEDEIKAQVASIDLSEFVYNSKLKQFVKKNTNRKLSHDMQKSFVYIDDFYSDFYDRLDGSNIKNIFFSINRLGFNPLKKKQLFMHNKLIPKISIKNNGIKLKLKGIIVYSHSHYLLYFENKKIWYEYDDMFKGGSDLITEIGDFTSLIKYNKKIISQSRIIWYSID